MTRQPDEAISHLRAARAAFDDGLDLWGSVAATDFEGMALYLLDDPTCLTVLDEALQRSRRLNPVVDSLQVRILTHIATVHVSRHAWREAVRYYEDAAKASENVRDLAQIARTYDGLSQAYARLGQTARAIGYANRALALYSTQSDLAAVYRAENNLGDLLLQIGEVDAAEPHLRRAFEGCQSLRLDRRGSGYVLVNLAELAFRKGDVSEAKSLIAQAKAAAVELGEKVVHANSELLLARIAAIDREPAHADRHFEVAIELLKNMNMPDRLREAHLEYGRVLKGRGELAGAADEFERAAELSLGVVAAESQVEAWA